MRVRVEPAAADDLLGFLRRAECRAERIDAETLEVEVPASHGEEQARMEVDLYLKAWQAAHPELEAQLLDPPRSRVADERSEAD